MRCIERVFDAHCKAFKEGRRRAQGDRLAAIARQFFDVAQQLVDRAQFVFA